MIHVNHMNNENHVNHMNNESNQNHMNNENHVNYMNNENHVNQHDKQSLLSLQMKTKIVQHVPRITHRNHWIESRDFDSHHVTH